MPHPKVPRHQTEKPNKRVTVVIAMDKHAPAPDSLDVRNVWSREIMESGEIEDVELSGDEEECFDERKHSKLLDAISSLDGKKSSKHSQRTVVSREVSEFSFSQRGGKSKVHLHELIGTLSKDSVSHGGLQKQLKTVQKRNKIISAPLPKHQKEKIDRTVAYQKTSDQLKKWDSVVEKNRQAEQMIFPLQRPNLKLSTTDRFGKKFKPQTPLELEVAVLLQGSQSVHHQKAELTRAEEKALQAMSLEEAQERRAELQKYRALMSYKEARARWQKRIKSKRYHRVLRKEKMKNEKKSLEDLKNSDPEGYLEKVNRVEDDRIQERMSLKHRGGSKYSRKQMIYAKFDSRSRQAVQDMIEKSRELRQKRVVDSDSDSEDFLEEDENESTVNEVQEGGDNPWMSNTKVLRTKKGHSEGASEKVAGEYSRAEIIADRTAQTITDSGIDSITKNIDEESKTDVIKKHISGVGKNIEEMFIELEQNEGKVNKTKKVETIERRTDLKSESSLTENSARKTNKYKRKKVPLIDEKLDRKSTLAEIEADSSDDEVLEDTEPSQQVDREKDSSERQKEEEVYVDPRKLFTKQSVLNKTEVPEVVDTADDRDQMMTIAEAFAGDDVVVDFMREKKEAVERDRPKAIDLTLPGWGNWGGQGLSISKKKRKRFLIRAPPSQPRKDRNLGNVIISEEKDVSISKIQVNDLPFPYTSVKQFEQSIRTPVGKTWVPETAHKQLVKPKVVTKLGQIIAPIDKSEVFSKQKGRKRKADMNFDGSAGGRGKKSVHKKFNKSKMRKS
ncbi:hypothetical protein ScPMuIL_012596 [Solemya velum]